MAVNIRRNFIYNSLLTVANYIFPLITYPYVSRVLGVSNIGICNFVDGVINYFVIFSMLGINTTAIRAVVAAREDRERLNRTFSSLLSLNMITTTLAILCLIVSIFAFPQLRAHKELLFVGVLKLTFNFLLIEWLYKGLENFRYVSLRSIAVKILYVVAVFLLVKESGDYPLYFLLTTMMIVVNAVVNLITARKYVRFSFKGIDIRPFVKPFLRLGFYNILITMYSSFNVIYLGFVGNEVDVGYYSTAMKIYEVTLALFSALTAVLFPRMTDLIGRGDLDGFKLYLEKTQKLLIAFSVPLVMVTVVMSPQLVAVISGPGYEGAITPMRILMPLVFIIGFGQIRVLQILLPMHQDKTVLLNSAAGAVWAILLNILLVSSLRSVGSSIVWLSSEVLVLVLSQIAAKRLCHIRFPFKEMGICLLWHLPLLLFVVLLVHWLPNPFVCTGVAFVVSALYCGILQLFILKEPLFLQFFHQAVSWARKRL